MAFGCKLHLKSECDGCMRCEDWGHSFSGARRNPYDDEDYDPFEIDYDDER